MRKLIWLTLIAVFCFVLASPAHAAALYIVQRGDTLYRIAVRFGVTVNALVSANGLPNANVIYVGQVLTIPDAAGSPTTPPVFTGQYVVQPGDTLYRIALRF